MPLTPHGNRMMSRLAGEYGEKKGEQVFYASRNAGKPGFENVEKRDAVKRRMSQHARADRS